MAIRSNIEEFIKKANIIHNHSYDYSKAIYINWSTKIIIKCKIHNYFSQTPNSHLNGRGCPDCGKENGIKNSYLNSEEYFDRVKIVHNNFYDYKKALYVNAKTNITITCPIHNDFSQIAGGHLNGNGCPKCSRKIGNNKLSVLKTTEPKEYFYKVNVIHKNFYVYHNDYVNTKTKILITCPLHGDFLQRPDVHLNGSGCAICGNINTAFWTTANKWKRKALKSTKFKSFKFYIFKFYNENENFFKFGITFQDIDKRFINLPYNNKLIYLLEDGENAEKIFNLEIAISKFVSKHRYTPKIKFKGHSECFNSDIKICDIISYIN